MGITWGPCRNHTRTTGGSSPYLSPILSWRPIFSLGTKAACQHPTHPSQHGHKPGDGSEHEGSLPLLPLPYVVLGSLSLSILGEPQSQALLPLLTFLPFRPGLPSSPGLPWEEKKAVREPSRFSTSQGHQQPGVPGPHWSLMGELGLPDGSSWDPQRAWDRMCPQGGWYLQGCRVVPGDPQGQVLPAPHAARAAPVGKEEGGSTRQQGTHLPQPALGARSVTGSGTLLGTGGSCCTALDQETWDRTLVPCKSDGPSRNKT